MKGKLQGMLRWPGRRSEAAEAEPWIAAVPGGMLLYAVGDVHARSDLLIDLLGQVHADLHASGAREARPLLLFLGDYVDRGPDPAGVIETILGLREAEEFQLVCLKGNHEEVLLNFLNDPSIGPEWVVHGGGDTLEAYGVAVPSPEDLEGWEEACAAFTRALPDAHLRFLRELELWAVCGDYVFVHAGIRPGVPLERQDEHDLLWIRRDFLAAARPAEKVIVHGHTPADAPQVRPGRIGIDTGAYASGVLTAVRLEGSSVRFLATRAGRG